MSEVWTWERWLVDRLKSDPGYAATGAMGVYGYVAPQGATFPYILFALLSARDENTLGSLRGPGRMVYVVRAVGQGEAYDPLVPLADYIDARLQGASIEDVEGLHAVIRREGQVLYAEAADDTRYYHIGGEYSVIFSSETSE